MTAPLFTPGYVLAGLCFAVAAGAAAALAYRRFQADPAAVAFWVALVLCLANGQRRTWEFHFGRQDMMYLAVPTALWVALLGVALSRVVLQVTIQPQTRPR